MIARPQPRLRRAAGPGSLRRASVLATVFASVLAPGTAAAELGPLDSPGPDLEPIVGGVPTQADELDAVVALRTANQLCTGTLISPTVVMTAAHCLDDAAPNSTVTVQFGPVAGGGDSVLAERFGVHPQYCDQCTEERYDFAYVELSEPYVPEGGYVEPIVLQAEWDEAMRLGNVVLVSGYGTEDPLDQTPITEPTKRKVTTTITDFTDQGFEFFAGGTGRDTCSGDSGGPAIVQLGNGLRRLAGVTSRGKVPCGDGGWYGVPFASLLWLTTETGVDLGCIYAGCLDTRPAEDEGRCSVGRPGSGTPWALLLLIAGARARRSAGRRRRGPSTRA